MLARGAAAEVLTGDEDRVGRQIPAGLLGPVEEQELAETGALDALEELLGHDLIGVHVSAVEMQRSPGCRMSGFMPRHIEQPATRQSKPASRKTRSRPSASACFFTC